jgi:hypothetical protein
MRQSGKVLFKTSFKLIAKCHHIRNGTIESCRAAGGPDEFDSGSVSHLKIVAGDVLERSWNIRKASMVRRRSVSNKYFGKFFPDDLSKSTVPYKVSHVLVFIVTEWAAGPRYEHEDLMEEH